MFPRRICGLVVTTRPVRCLRDKEDILMYLELGIVDPTLAMIEMSMCSF